MMICNLTGIMATSGSSARATSAAARNTPSHACKSQLFYKYMSDHTRDTRHGDNILSLLHCSRQPRQRLRVPFHFLGQLHLCFFQRRHAQLHTLDFALAPVEISEQQNVANQPTLRLKQYYHKSLQRHEKRGYLPSTWRSPAAAGPSAALPWSPRLCAARDQPRAQSIPP